MSGYFSRETISNIIFSSHFSTCKLYYRAFTSINMRIYSLALFFTTCATFARKLSVSASLKFKGKNITATKNITVTHGNRDSNSRLTSKLHTRRCETLGFRPGVQEHPLRFITNAQTFPPGQPRS